MGDFDERMAQLDNLVGQGTLEMQVIVDQAYAQDQHESVWYKHPAGGKAKYLSDPLFVKSGVRLQRLANRVLDGRLREGMIDEAEDLVNDVYEEAPWEFADLRASGQPIVRDDGAIIYDRPPNQGRLTQADLDAKDDLRELGLGHNP